MYPGHCKVCGKATHEIVKQHPLGHPLAGRPTKIGKALPGIVKAHFLLTNGSWATMAVHGKCAAKITPDYLPKLWQLCLFAARWEEDNRSAIGAEPLKATQKEIVEKHILALASQILLGPCCIEEIGNGA